MSCLCCLFVLGILLLYIDINVDHVGLYFFLLFLFYCIFKIKIFFKDVFSVIYYLDIGVQNYRWMSMWISVAPSLLGGTHSLSMLSLALYILDKTFFFAISVYCY